MTALWKKDKFYLPTFLLAGTLALGASYFVLEFKIFNAYLLAINIAAFAVFGLDKFSARISTWRMSEKLILAVALLGATPAILLGMNIFRHKTQKDRFKLSLALLMLLQVLAVKYILG